jgi:hypothetical protein
MQMRILALLSPLAFVACGGKAPAAASATANPCAGDPCGDPCGGDPGGMAAPDFSAWAGFTKVTGGRIFSKGHGKKWVDIYVPPTVAGTYRAGQGPYPVGTRIVKAQYASESASAVAALTVMAKMAPGYDPEHGDWFYGIYDASGANAQKSGKIAMCINCHDQASDRDYLFGAK